MAVERSQTYDCSLLNVDDDFDVLPCQSHAPTWPIVGNQLLFGLLVWCIFVVFTKNHLAPWWQRVCMEQPEGSPPPWARLFVGERSRRAEEPLLEQVLEWGQFGSSTVLVVTFIMKTYQLSSLLPGWVFYLEVGCACVCALHGLFAYARASFSVGHAFSLIVLIDCFTLPATFLQHAPSGFGGGSWLTLNYLRTFHQLASLRRLRETGALEHFMSDFASEVSFATIEVINVIITISGTMWILETLGDIPTFEDRFWTSGMGDVSFFSMVYFTFCTISTVGYGDYTPSTVQSRVWIVLSIFAGVTFFSYMSVSLLNIIEMEASGRGRFTPRPKQHLNERGHILIVGGGVTSGSAIVMETFLKALCASRSNVGCDAPEVVLLSQTARSESLAKMLKQPWASKLQLHFFIGSPVAKEDMDRVHAEEASMVFVIADTETEDTLVEDQRNIMIAASITRQFPTLQFRLMMVGLPALRLASQVGLSEFNFFSVEAFKAALAGTSLRCPGFSTLWLNLALPNLPNTMHGYQAGLRSGQEVTPWLREYTIGSDLEPYGLLLAERFLGKTFREAAMAIAREANLLLVAAHIDGAIVVNPSDVVLESDMVMFCFAEDQAACDAIAKDGTSRVSSWLGQFTTNRKTGGFANRQRAKVVMKHSEASLEHVHLASLSNFDNSGGEQNEAPSPVYEAAQQARRMSESSSGVGGGPKAINGGRLMLPAMGGVFNHLSEKASSSVAPQTSVPHVHTTAEWHDELPDSKTSPKEARLNMERCKAAAKVGGHTLVILCRDPDNYDQQTVWAQLEITVSTASLHCSTAPSVVVVHEPGQAAARNIFLASHPNGPEGSILASDLVSFLVGDPMEATVLQAAGADTCGRLVTLAPSAPPPDLPGAVASSDTTLDELNLVLMMVLENHLKVWGRTTPLPIVFDMYVPRSAILCPAPAGTSASFGKGVTRVYTGEEKKERELKKKQMQEADARIILTEPRAHPRFAAGHVLPKPCISAVYSMAYYTPGVLELLEALANPAKYDQNSYPILVSIQESLPGAIGCPYSELAAALFNSKAIPLGLLRAPTETNGATLPYVVTALPNQSSLVVGYHDSIYVLAHTEWLLGLSSKRKQQPPRTPLSPTTDSSTQTTGSSTQTQTASPPELSTPNPLNEEEPASSGDTPSKEPTSSDQPPSKFSPVGFDSESSPPGSAMQSRLARPVPVSVSSPSKYAPSAPSFSPNRLRTAPTPVFSLSNSQFASPVDRPFSASAISSSNDLALYFASL